MDFQVEQQFPEHPRCYRAVCEACGVGERSPVVHVSSISIDHEDGLYTGLWLCHECVREWGRKLGMIDVAQADELREGAMTLQSLLGDALEELEALRPVRAALEAAAAEWLDRATSAVEVELVPVERDITAEEAAGVVASSRRVPAEAR